MKKILEIIARYCLMNRKNPKYIHSLYLFSKAYCKFYNNYENCDMKTNGEYFFIDHIIRDLKPKVVFDIGTNKGEYAQKINSLLSHGANIHCFEPDQRMFKLLQNTFSGNKNIRVNQLALSDKHGLSKFYLNKEDPGLNSLFDMNSIGYDYNNKSIDIHTDTIDQYCLTNNIDEIDFIKIDVEGGELSVLKGGKQMFSKNAISMVQFEYGNASIASRTFLKDFFDFFTHNNFHIFTIMPKGLRKMEYSSFNEKISYANIVAIINGIEMNNQYIVK